MDPLGLVTTVVVVELLLPEPPLLADAPEEPLADAQDAEDVELAGGVIAALPIAPIPLIVRLLFTQSRCRAGPVDAAVRRLQLDLGRHRAEDFPVAPAAPCRLIEV
jgi:hypothetical protein